MKVLTYNDRAHRPTCKRAAEKGVLTPIVEALALTPATCCHPERLAAWREALEAQQDTPPTPDPEVDPVPQPTPHVKTQAQVRAEVDAEPETEVRVLYPDSLARHFFRALAKIGGGTVAGELGVPYRSRGVEYAVYLGGKNIANLDTFLPTLWIAADAALKEWRKKDPAYLAFDLSDKAEAKQAFEAEQEFLEDFCAANTVHPHRKSSPGFKAGAAWRVL